MKIFTPIGLVLLVCLLGAGCASQIGDGNNQTQSTPNDQSPNPPAPPGDPPEEISLPDLPLAINESADDLQITIGSETLSIENHDQQQSVLGWVKNLASQTGDKIKNVIDPVKALAIKAIIKIPEEDLEKITDITGQVLSFGIETAGSYIGAAVGLAVGTAFLAEFGGSIFGPLVGRLVGTYSAKVVSYIVRTLIGQIPNIHGKVKEELIKRAEQEAMDKLKEMEKK